MRLWIMRSTASTFRRQGNYRRILTEMAHSKSFEKDPLNSTKVKSTGWVWIYEKPE